MTNKKYIYSILGIIIIIGILFVGGKEINNDNLKEEIATEDENTATSIVDDVVDVVPEVTSDEVVLPTTPHAFLHPFSLVQGDVVSDWNFVGAYTPGSENAMKAYEDIKKFEKLLDTGEMTNYIIYVGIASIYELLGDGENEYIYLGKALAIDSKTTGLAWHNMGKLLEKVGAYKSALIAYTNAVVAQPISQYQLARLEFLEKNMPDSTALIEEAKIALYGTTTSS